MQLSAKEEAMGYIAGVGRDQQILFPETLEEYVTHASAVRVIERFVGKLDLVRLGFSKATPAETGRPGYDPRDLLRLYLYGYLYRLRSSRAMEREAERNVEVMWLLRKLRPDFRTIAAFRREHPEALKGVYGEFNRFCAGASLIGGKEVAVDGSKFQAANGREKNQTQNGLRSALKRLEEQTRRYLEELDAQDEKEKGEADIAGELAKLSTRKAELEALLEEMEAQGQTQRSTTDPESRRMKVRGGGTGVSYNVQAAVDAQHHLIIAFEVTNAENDQNQLSGMARAAKEALEEARGGSGAAGPEPERAEEPSRGVEPEPLKVVADTGYFDGKEIVACLAAGVLPFVPHPRNSSKNGAKGLFTNEAFRYDDQRDVYVCPAGQALSYQRSEKHRGREMRLYMNRAACAGCPKAARCHANQQGRYIRRLPEAVQLEEMRRRVRENPELMRSRSRVVEHAFGSIKRWMDQGYFLLRGIRKTRGEFALSALAYNFKRAMKVLGTQEMLRRLDRWRPGVPSAASA